MKITIEISPALLAEAKSHALAEHITLDALIKAGLRRVLTDQKQDKPFVLRDGSVGGDGLMPEFQNAPWGKFRDAIYEGRG